MMTNKIMTTTKTMVAKREQELTRTIGTTLLLATTTMTTTAVTASSTATTMTTTSTPTTPPHPDRDINYGVPASVEGHSMEVPNAAWYPGLEPLHSIKFEYHQCSMYTIA